MLITTVSYTCSTSSEPLGNKTIYRVIQKYDKKHNYYLVNFENID